MMPAQRRESFSLMNLAQDFVITNPNLLDYFSQFTKVIENEQAALKALGGIYVFEFTLDNGDIMPITIDAAHGPAKMFIGNQEDKPTVVLKISMDTFEKIHAGKMSEARAFLTGKIWWSGSVTEAYKFVNFFSPLVTKGYKSSCSMVVLMI